MSRALFDLISKMYTAWENWQRKDNDFINPTKKTKQKLKKKWNNLSRSMIVIGVVMLWIIK